MKFGCRNISRKDWVPDRIWGLNTPRFTEFFWFHCQCDAASEYTAKVVSCVLSPWVWSSTEGLIEQEFQLKTFCREWRGGRKKEHAGAQADVLLQILQNGLGKYHFPSAWYHTPAHICCFHAAEPHSCPLPMLLVCFTGSSGLSSSSWLRAEVCWSKLGGPT